MGRKKAAENCEIRPWLSANLNNRERRFIQVGNTLFHSKDFNELSPGAQMLYLRMAMESGGANTLTFTIGTAKKQGIPKTSYKRYAKELEDAGFVERIEKLEQYAVAEYRFDFRWKQKPLPKLDIGKRDTMSLLDRLERMYAGDYIQNGYTSEK